MFPYPQSVTPAIRTHLDAQMAFFSDLSKSLSRSFQSVLDANIQLSQSMLQDSAIISQQLLAAAGPTDTLSTTAARAQPAVSTFQAYQQQLARVAAETQAELSKVAAEHVQHTARTAQSLVEEVARAANDQNQRAVRQQEEHVNTLRDPFEGARRHEGNQSMAAHPTMQAGGAPDAGAQAGQRGSEQGHAQAGVHGHPSAQAGQKKK